MRVWPWAALLIVTGASQVAADAQLTSVDIGAHETFTRIVFRLDQFTEYEIDQTADGSVQIAVSNVSGNPGQVAIKDAHLPVRALLHRRLETDWVTTIETAEPITVDSFTLTDSDDGSFRIVVDLRAIKPLSWTKPTPKTASTQTIAIDEEPRIATASIPTPSSGGLTAAPAPALPDVTNDPCKAHVDEVLKQRDNLDALTLLARCRTAQGALSEAQSVFRRVLAADPDLHGIRTELAEVQAKQGLRDEAIATYRQALTRNPPPDIARQIRLRLDELEQQQGRIDLN